MTLRSFNYALLGAIALTFCVMALPHFLPKKTLQVIPNSNLITFLLSNTNEDQRNHAFWVDQSKHHWRCVVGEVSKDWACSFNLLFSENVTQGIDLSSYSGMNISLKYQGNAPRIRLHLRSVDERFSTPEDSNSSKFHFVTVFTRDFEQVLYIGMDEWRVADWWLNQYNLPRHMSRPDFRHSVTMGLDFDNQLPPGSHDILIEKIEFVGDAISFDHWYPGIILIWLTLGGSLVVAHLIQLNRQSKQDRQQITELNWSNRHLKSESEKFRKQSTTDALTGVLNRHGLNQVIEEIDAHKQQDLALILIDVDHFKRINDRRGHDEGDNILKSLANLVQSNLRDQDIFGRWGGEEFILLCPRTSIVKAQTIAEKIRVLIADTRFGNDRPLLITASFGVGVVQANEDFSTVFKRVDAALYQAKTLGRNCVVVAQGSLE